MSSSSVKHISECFIKPPYDLSPEEKQPIHLTPFELPFFNGKYSQKGLLFAKPPPPGNQDFSIATFLDDLQHSLSSALAQFYPLAARFATREQENPSSYVIYIDPENIAGAKFVYATADVTVSEILTSTDVPSVVHSFFDLNDAINRNGYTLPLLSIQVTELVDGIFIGGSINHVVADGTSFWHFMATWSEIFKSKEQYHGSISRPPVLKRWVLEGSDPIINLPYTHKDQFIKRLKVPPFKERFFHFSSSSVSKLKSKANWESKTQKISSLQAVVALIWRCVTRARCIACDEETGCSLMVSVRSRLKPQLSDDYFGNPIQAVRATAKVGDVMDRGLGWAALQLNKAVMNHDDGVVKKQVESWLRSPTLYKMGQLAYPNPVHVGSSPRFDMYGCSNKGDGKITMYPGREGGGSMDVEVCLFPEYMINIESDEEFMSALRG